MPLSPVRSVSPYRLAPETWSFNGIPGKRYITELAEAVTYKTCVSSAANSRVVTPTHPGTGGNAFPCSERSFAGAKSQGRSEAGVFASEKKDAKKLAVKKQRALNQLKQSEKTREADIARHWHGETVQYFDIF
eukprot:g16741.t1